METAIEGDVVSGILARNPDVFVFLMDVIQSQMSDSSRFRPVPRWFATTAPNTFDIASAAEQATSELMDIPRFSRALAQVSWREWREWECRDDVALAARLGATGRDAYMAARFVALSCPLQLEGITKHVESGASDTIQFEQFRVRWSDAEEQAWERSGADATPEYLYHGSVLRNWYSILRNGIRVTSHTKWMTAGAVHGTGIYCSDAFSLSWSYSGGRGKVVVGVYEIWNAEQYRKWPHVYVVPREDQLRLRYLIFMPDSSKVNATKLNQTFRDEWLHKGRAKAAAIQKKRARIQARIAKETLVITAAGWRVEQVAADHVRVHRGPRVVDVHVPHEFPFAAPQILECGVVRELPEWTPRSTLVDVLN